MAPNDNMPVTASSDTATSPNTLTSSSSTTTSPELEVKGPPPREYEVIKTNVFWMVMLHLAALYGLFLVPWAHPYSWLWSVFLYNVGALGVTAGAHRLWAHRTYKAKLPFRILLAIMNTVAYQNSVIDWARDHRVHHKYSETDADPHNAKRGFFFSHVGWLLTRKHPDVVTKGKGIDISDLYADPVIAFQKKVYGPGVFLLCFLIPTLIPWYCWGEDLKTSYFLCAICRYVLLLNGTWLVNSAAHLHGNKPYDKGLNPSQNLWVVLTSIGEGFHNYHHAFPQDYSASEFWWFFNPSTLFIDVAAALGQVTSRTKVSKEMVNHRRDKAGDGTSGFGFFQKSKFT